MEAGLPVDEQRQRIQVRGLQLRVLAPLLDLLDDGMLRADRLQDARVRRVTGLPAALAREPELLEEHLPELLRRADRELLPRELPHLALELADPLFDLLRDDRQAVGVELDFSTAGAASEEVYGAAFAYHFNRPLPRFRPAHRLDHDIATALLR